MPFTIRARQTQTFKIPAGSASQPSLTFSNATSSGLFHSGGQGNVGVSVNGVERLTIHANGISVNGTVTANSLVINNASTVQYAPFSLANVQIADAAWTVLDDTAVSTDGGYIVINGNGFWGGTVVTVDSTPAIASSVLSYTKIGAQVPAKSAGTYAVSVVRPDALSVTLPTGLTYSPFPVWSTGSTLANVFKYSAFTQTLAATEALGSNIIYTVANGSSLPANVTLSSGGVLSGNILTDPGNTTTYSFSIQATDAQFQNIPRIFGLTALERIFATIGEVKSIGGVVNGVYKININGTFREVYFDLDGSITGDSTGWMLYQSFGPDNYTPAAKGQNIQSNTEATANGWTVVGTLDNTNGGQGNTYEDPIYPNRTASVSDYPGNGSISLNSLGLSSHTITRVAIKYGNWWPAGDVMLYVNNTQVDSISASAGSRTIIRNINTSGTLPLLKIVENSGVAYIYHIFVQ